MANEDSHRTAAAFKAFLMGIFTSTITYINLIPVRINESDGVIKMADVNVSNDNTPTVKFTALYYISAIILWEFYHLHPGGAHQGAVNWRPDVS